MSLIIVMDNWQIHYWFNEVDWTLEEVKTIKEYCRMNDINDISEFAFMAMYSIHKQLGVKYKDGDGNIPIEFSGGRLESISEYMLDEIMILTESTKEVHFNYVDMEILFSKISLFVDYLKGALFLNNKLTKSYRVFVDRGNLICQEYQEVP